MKTKIIALILLVFCIITQQVSAYELTDNDTELVKRANERIGTSEVRREAFATKIERYILKLDKESRAFAMFSSLVKLLDPKVLEVKKTEKNLSYKFRDKYDMVFDFTGGLAVVASGHNHFGRIDMDGNLVEPLGSWTYNPIYLLWMDSPSNDFSLGYDNNTGKKIILDANGKKVPMSGYEIPDNTLTSIGLFIVFGMDRTEQGAPFAKYTIVNANGEKVIQEEYEDIVYYGEGQFRTKKNGKYGLIDATGKTIVPFEYISFPWFAGGLVVAKKFGSPDNERCIIYRDGYIRNIVR